MIPKYNELYKDILQILSNGEIYNIKDVKKELIKVYDLSSEELEELLPSSTQSVFDSRVGWARTYLYKAKLINKIKRGEYQITKRGLDALHSNQIIDNKYLSQFEEFKNFTNNNYHKNKETSDCQTPDDLIKQAIDEINNLLALELKEKY